MTSGMKECPYCGEEILAAAIKCKHCGEFLNGRPSGKQPENKSTGGAGLALGITALVFGILAFVISWIPFLGLLGLPLSGLGAVFAVVGLVIGISSKRGSAIGFSVAGGAISVVALVLAFGSTAAVGVASGQLTEALDRGRQRRSMADMRNIATANGILRVDTGRYATSLDELRPGYMQVVPTADGWGTAFLYELEGDGYRLTSLGSDGEPGPTPPVRWPNAPYEPDIVLEDGRFVQAPTGQQ